MSSIAPWHSYVSGEPEGDRVIIALLPDLAGMTQVAHLNKALAPFSWSEGGIVFSERPDGGANSVPHMTLLQFDCKRVEDLTLHLAQIHKAWARYSGIQRDINLYCTSVERYRNRATGAATPFAFWWIDPGTSAFNTSFMSIARLVLFGTDLGTVPCKQFATHGSLVPSGIVTTSEMEMLRTVGYSHAGQWHVTVGYVTPACDIEAVVGPYEGVLRFSHLALARAGRNGTIVEILQTWNL